MSANPFIGINPHLNSLLQTPGTADQPSLWSSFHSTHINHIADLLNQQLPPQYTAYAEQSLQVRGVDWGDEIILTRPRPDVSIFRAGPASAVVSAAGAATAPTFETALVAVLEPVHRPVAVVIRQAGASGLGRVVTRIELISPSNKPGGAEASAYQDRRAEALASGTPLIEMDYLHEMPPLLPDIAPYPADASAYPYAVLVSDPRPTWETGRFRYYGFGVDSPAPRVPLPLADADSLLFDFDACYQHTFQARRLYNLVDYRRDPARFETYRADDQARIRARMQALTPP